MTTPILEVDAVAKAYGPVVALKSVRLTVRPGEIHALLGANGAGKSTLVKALAGVHAPDAGTIAVNGVPTRLDRPSDAMAAGIATVFQDPALIPDLTVEQNFRLTGVAPDAVRAHLAEMRLGDLDFDLLVSELPLETLRLLDLARALSFDPEILLLDEITAALPADQAEHVFTAMRQRSEAGKAVLFITHRLAEVLRMCNKATVLRDGRDVAALVPTDEDELLAAMLGEHIEIGAVSRRMVPDDAPVVLAANGLRSKDKVKGASFDLRAGEILGVAALDGQGQERLFELLSGDRRPEAGTIEVDGEVLEARSPFDAIDRGVVLVPGDRLHALLPQQSVRHNMALPFYNRATAWFGLESGEETAVASAVDRLSVDTRAQRQVRRLSGGNQQKVVLGRWLTTGFKTLLCFDPTRGIDLQTKQQIYDLLKELADQGAAVLLFTSELQEIPLVCDRVLVMYDGTFVHEQEAATATEDVLLAAAHGLAEGA